MFLFFGKKIKKYYFPFYNELFHAIIHLSYFVHTYDLEYHWQLWTSFYPMFLVFVWLDILHAMYSNPYPIHLFFLLLDEVLRLRHVHEYYPYYNGGRQSKLRIAAFPPLVT